jgi:hypothetical protein
MVDIEISFDGRSYNKFLELLIVPENISDENVKNSWAAQEMVHRFLPNDPYISSDLACLRDAINIVFQRKGLAKVILYTSYCKFL